MADTDLLIQNLRRENEALRAELERKQEKIELARRSSGASMHRCGSSWAYCDGQCTGCFKSMITTTDRTRVTKRYNGGENDNGY